MRKARVYWSLIRINFLISLEYRSTLFLSLVGVFALNLVDIALLGFVLAEFTAIGGWTFWEIVMLTFFYVLVLGLENMFAVHLLDLEHYVRDGRFDRFLIRPVSPLLQLLGQEWTLRYVDHLILGSLGIYLAYENLNLSWGMQEWLLFSVSLVSSAILLGCLVLILSSLAFWTVRSSPFVFSTLEVQEAVQHYPVHIFGKGFVLAVTFVLPFAFMNYYPLLALLDRQSEALHPLLPYTTPLVTVVFGIVAWLVWRAGVNKYQSTGS